MPTDRLTMSTAANEFRKSLSGLGIPVLEPSLEALGPGSLWTS